VAQIQDAPYPRVARLLALVVVTSAGVALLFESHVVDRWSVSDGGRSCDYGLTARQKFAEDRYSYDIVIELTAKGAEIMHGSAERWRERGDLARAAAMARLEEAKRAELRRLDRLRATSSGIRFAVIAAGLAAAVAVLLRRWRVQLPVVAASCLVLIAGVLLLRSSVQANVSDHHASGPGRVSLAAGGRDLLIVCGVTICLSAIAFVLGRRRTRLNADAARSAD